MQIPSSIGRVVISNALVATVILFFCAFLLLNENSWIAISGRPFMYLFWKSPKTVVAGYVLTTLCLSIYLQRKWALEPERKKVWLHFVYFTLIYAVVINLSHDLGFCFDMWRDVVDMGKSYCRPEAYFSIERVLFSILIASGIYAIALSIFLLVANLGVLALQKKGFF